MKRVLVACERSRIVAMAFERLGWYAMSCDILPAEQDGEHYQGDMFDVFGIGWDLVIAHPPCTYIAVSGNRWYAGTQARIDSVKFVERIVDFDGYRGPLAIENPVGVLSTMSKLGKASLYIQPWQFGHGEAKKTGLWLRDLPKLQPTDIVTGRDNRIWKMAPSPERQTERSRTYTGIAAAMADQWGRLI